MINIESKTEDGIYELMVEGEIDASSSIHLDNSLSEAIANNNKIIVDLAKLEYISSAGLGVFMSYLQQIKNDSIQLVLFGMNENVLEVFQILGLDQLIDITNTKSEALAKMKDA
ncbi:MAG: STAS domain-containing protein [Cyclobacteriaceae bacterium]|jgi:anti-sigma B factor antagonist|nr:STAS domain-containing protein [Cyclobacteriaceae bacterium]